MSQGTFEFECDSLYSSTIEDIICNHYDLGYANSSNFAMLKLDENNKIRIYATGGNISCTMRVYKKADGDKYLVSVFGVVIS